MTRESPRWPPTGTPEWFERAAALKARLGSPEAVAARARLGTLGRDLGEGLKRVRLRMTVTIAVAAAGRGDHARTAEVLGTLRTADERAQVAALALTVARNAEGEGGEHAAAVVAGAHRVAELLEDMTAATV